ncbi:MAG: alpha/beta fold hydrolase [Actinomycetota bacterium]|nr:alpha/beta fold hydrolase [Actinomycetota bacterium]
MEDRLIVVANANVATAYRPAQTHVDESPLLVALHGGTYTSAYFAVAGGPFGSFFDVAARNGFDVVSIDRPGYGASDSLLDDENDFLRQAEILDAVVSELAGDLGARSVVLVGHSIGGMIALEIAARRPAWPLVGVSATGMGARIPPGGAAEQLGSAPLEGVIDLPIPDREAVMFGPAGVSEHAREAARASYAPTPFIELKRAPMWARERLDKVAAEVAVPVQNFLAEHDALWDSSTEALDDFASRFADGAGATATLVRGVGHSIDHHLLGASVHLQQLAFAYACAIGS